MRIRIGAFLFIATVTAPAQTFGEITGQVADATGALVAGAAVTATNAATSGNRTTTSNEAGIYSFPSLQPGQYSVKVAAKGFRAVSKTGIELQVQQTARVDFSLEIGAVTETVEVSASGAMLTTENATVGTVIENKRIVELPLNGRNFLQLVSLSPNVSFGFANSGQANARQGGTRSQQNISLAGQRSMFNRFTLDGIENTDVNFNTYVILPSIDALQEFKVQTGVYPAEFGRAVSQINVSTKSGGNQFHGALFEFLRNEKLDARNYAFTALRPAKDPFKWNQYGFTLSGPVWIPKIFNGRNRLFFMSNFEGYRDRKQLRGIYNVPSQAMREGDFSGRSAIFDPVTRAREGTAITATQFPGNVIPRSRFHPTAIKLLEFYPAPNVATGSLSSNFQNGRRRVIDKDQFIQRVDWTESANSSWFGRYSWGDELQLEEALLLNGSKLLTGVHQAMVTNTRVLSPVTVNEIRFGYNQFNNSTARELAGVRDVNAELGLPGMPSPPPIGWGIPEVSLAPYSTFGDSTEGPYVNNNHIYQVVDNFSWVRGKHSFRFGGEIRIDRYNQVGNQFPRGFLGFDPITTQNPAAPAGTGDSFAAFLTGYNRSAQGVVALAEVKYRALSHYYYIDDTWKVRPNLTLSFGLRYENTPPWLDKAGKAVNLHMPFVGVVPNEPAERHPTFIRTGAGDFYEDVLLRFNPAIRVARDGRLGDRLVLRDNNDWAPRIGIAWNPGRWSIRTGFGAFYSQDTGNPKFDLSRNLAGRRNDTSNTDIPDLTMTRPFRDLGSTVQINTPAVLANNHARRTPYSLQYLLNVQREVGGTVFEGGYLGSVSRKIESYRDYNNPRPSPIGSPVARLPFPEFSRIFMVDGHGRGNYHSLALKAQRRLSKGLTALAGYTWSKSIDTGSAIRNHDGDVLFPQDSFCINECERGLSSYHAGHRFTFSSLYELPFGRSGSKAARLLAGGWQIGSILTLQSGFPLTVTSGRDQSNTANGLDRANVNGQKVALERGRQDPERFFNTQAFSLQPFGTYGSSGRNNVIGPGIINLDASMIKDFAIGERVRLQFRFEMFNAPNHPNWGLPDGNVTSPNFGKVRATRTDMRDLQFGLKALW
ncbi:MAG: carboxypeptidase regulatory-like domain-containing protein [Bryobacteraceae bacterium]